MKRISVCAVAAIATDILLVTTGCSPSGPTSVTVGPPASSDIELSCTNRHGMALEVAMDAQGAPTVEEALADPPRRVNLPNGTLVASKLPSPSNTYVLTRGDKRVGTAEVSPVNGGWLITEVTICD